MLPSLESCASVNPLAWCEQAYLMESYAYRQLSGIPEAPRFYGSLTAIINDADGERVVCLVLMECIAAGVPITEFPALPKSVFTAMMVADIKMIRRKVVYVCRLCRQTFFACGQVGGRWQVDAHRL